MDTKTLNKKLISGFLTLTFRRIILLVITYLVTNIWLAKILTPDIIGVFNIATSILTFFTYFSDVGLAAAVIQKKDLDENDLKTTFTIQQILVGIICIIVFFLAPFFTTFYSLDPAATWLIRALGIGFFLSSLKVLPSVLLERKLEFKPLVSVEIAETIIRLALLVILSYQHWGINAYTVSVLAQSITGTTLIYLIAPWKIKLGISKDSLKKLINFGVPFQLNSLLALLKDRLVPLVIARMVGATGVGYITWAQNIAFMSLEVMNIMTRVMFPAFARLQDNKEELRKTLERTIFITCLLFYPVLFGTLAIAPSLVAHVVSPKWLPALPMIYLFAINAFWSAISTSFTNFLNAIGRIGITLKLMVMWTILEWLMSPLLTVFFNIYGVAIAQSVIAFTSIIPIIIVVRMIKIDVIAQVWKPLLAAIIMGVLTYFVATVVVTNFLTLLVVVGAGAIVYSGLIFLLARDRLILTFQFLRHE